jgi:hypothetical protein
VPRIPQDLLSLGGDDVGADEERDGKVSHSLMMTEKRPLFSPRGDMVGLEGAKMDACEEKPRQPAAHER